MTCRFQLHRIADRALMMENGEKVADVDKHGMTGEQLDHASATATTRIGQRGQAR